MKIHLKILFLILLVIGAGWLVGCGGGGRSVVIEIGGKKGRIRGTVRDAQGNPIANATISVPGTNIAAQTDANGNFDVKLALGTTELTAAAQGFLTNGATVDVMRQDNNFVVFVLTPGNNPPIAGNQPPQLGVLTVNPAQIAVTGTVNFNVIATDNDSTNLTAIAVVIAPNGTITGVPLARTGNTLTGSFVVPPNANRNDPPQTYTIIASVTDANNGSNQTATSTPATFTVDPPLSPPPPGLQSKVKRAGQKIR